MYKYKPDPDKSCGLNNYTKTTVTKYTSNVFMKKTFYTQRKQG